MRPALFASSLMACSLMACALMACALGSTLAARAQTPAPVVGHGGPVRAIAISPDGQRLVTGGLDQMAIVWSPANGQARAILRAHDSSVNALAATGDAIVSAGEDGRIAVWRVEDYAKPRLVFGAHDGPIAAIALAPDGRSIASASWDSSVRVHALDDGRPLHRFEGHTGNVNGVAFVDDGRMVASGGYDATLRLWPLDGGAPRVVSTPSPINALARVGARVAVGGADGHVRFYDLDGAPRGDVVAAEAPIVALAVSPDAGLIAAASPRGAVAVIDAQSLRLRFTLNGPGLPVWSLVFAPDGRQIFTGGGDRMVRRWDAASGDALGALSSPAANDDFGALNGTRGADVFRACAICHALSADAGPRAGPTLAGVFGRRAGSLPGYAYSDAFRRLDLVWTEETIARLFNIGPQAYTPGTKMPEQRLSAEDRAALIAFLHAATKPAR